MPGYERPDDDAMESDWLDQTNDMYPPEEELPSDLGPEELLSARAQDTLQRHREAAIQRAAQRERARNARLQQAAARSAQRLTPVTPLRICAALDRLARSSDPATVAPVRRALSLVARLAVQQGFARARTTIELLRLLADAQIEAAPLHKDELQEAHALVARFHAQLRFRA